MFIRKKPNKSGLISVQVIDKSHGTYRVIQTIGASKDPVELERLTNEGKRFIEHKTGVLKLDFTDYRSLYSEVLSSYSNSQTGRHSLCLGENF